MHCIDFRTVRDLRAYLTAFEHWVYVSDGNTEWSPACVGQPKIYKRLSADATRGLVVRRFADEPNDMRDGYTLRPRTELVPVFLRLPRRRFFRVRYVVTLAKGKGRFRGLIFQITDKTRSGKQVFPFQLEVRDDALHTRWNTLDADGERADTRIARIAPAAWGTPHDLRVEGVLSNREGAFLNVYHDGTLVAQVREPTAGDAERDPQVQYGIYAERGVALETHVRLLHIET